MITLETFLASYDSYRNKSVICFVSNVESLQLARAMSEYCTKLDGTVLMSHSMHMDDVLNSLVALQSTFLGQTYNYWLGSLDGLSTKAFDSWIVSLSHYQGPHRLWFVCKQELVKKQTSWLTVTIPDTISQPLFIKLNALFGNQKPLFAKKLYEHTMGLAPDTAYMMMLYGRVVGQHIDRFCKEWIPELVVPDVSLFALSDALFSKKTAQFYELWKKIAPIYAEPFWITFWSEQLWRAYHYIRYQQVHSVAEAKKMGYRLPFSFLNRTWHSHSLAHLKQAHAQLYEVDYQLKNGGSSLGFELVFSMVLQKMQ